MADSSAQRRPVLAPAPPELAPSSAPGAPPTRRFARPWTALNTVVSTSAVGLVVFVCFYHLGSRSLGRGDESLYALATQGTGHSTHWWLPMWDNRPYFMTAPLKLWVNLLIQHVIGESNFSFRLADAVSGLLTFLLLAVAASRLLRDRRAAVLSVVLLAGCRGYILLHGPRQGVLDGMLLFFTTLAFYAGWRIVEPYVCDGFAGRSRGNMRWAVVGGFALGLGFMTKSAGVLPPLAVIGLFCLAERQAVPILRGAWRELLVCLGTATLLAAPYYAGHCFFSDHACESLIGVNVVRRVTDGYINQHDYTFYLRIIFLRRRLVPPELLLLGFWVAARRIRRPEYAFLLLWTLVPLVTFSLIPSRLPWYIASAYPAMAMVSAAGLLAVYDGLRRSHARPAPAWSTLILVAVLIVGAGTTALHAAVVIAGVIQPERRSALDTASAEILKSGRESGTPPKVLLYRTFDLPFQEMPYRNMLWDFTTRVDDRDQIGAAVAAGNFDFFIAPVSGLPFVTAQAPLSSYAVVPGVPGRSWPIVVGSWRADFRSKRFRAPAAAIFVHGRRDGMLYGWGDDGEFPTVSYRWGVGPASSLLLSVDPVMAELGLRITPHLAVHDAAEVRVYLGQKRLGIAKLEPGDFHYLPLWAPGEALHIGDMPLTFVVTPAEGGAFGNSQPVLQLSSIRTELSLSPDHLSLDLPADLPAAGPSSETLPAEAVPAEAADDPRSVRPRR